MESVTNNTKHYIDIFSEAVDSVMPKESKEITYVEDLLIARAALLTQNAQIQR
jgi:DNA replication licensing factor MCM7